MNTHAINNPVYDESLRNFMLSIYNHTSMGLLLTGVVAYLTYSSGVMASMGILMWAFIFAPLVMIIWWSIAGRDWSAASTKLFYYTFTAIIGISLSTIFAVYTAISIAQVFFITSSVFAGASLYGYTTKKDISGWGSFLIIGLFGIILASIVNIFLQSDAVEFAVSVIGVLIFTGLTAYDTQNAKTVFLTNSMSSEDISKTAITIALSLYLNFINLFQMLLNLLGDYD